MDRPSAVRLAASIQRSHPEIAVRLEGSPHDSWLLCARLYRTAEGLNSFELLEVRTGFGWTQWQSRIDASQGDDKEEREVAVRGARARLQPTLLPIYRERA